MTELADANAILSESATSTEMPACLRNWAGNSYRLVSLYDVLRFQAEHFCRASSLLGQLFMDVKSGRTPRDMTWSVIGGELGLLQRLCEELDLPITLSQIKRIDKLLDRGQGQMGIDYLAQQMIEVQTRLNDELASRMIYMMKAGAAEYLSAFAVQSDALNPSNLEKSWAPIFSAFGGTKYDFTESLRCFGVARYTASVFHLMRGLEIGLSVLARKFNVPSDHTNWHTIIEGIEKAVRLMGSDAAKTPDWKDQQEFFSQAASHFMVLKDAWRNYTAHARGKYTEEEAEILLINVRGFMQKLATRLHE